MKQQLFDTTPRTRWTGTRAVELHRGKRGCSRCSIGELIRLEPHIQPALFIHGGFGAAERLTYDLCLSCRHVTVISTETLNPRTL